MSVDALSTVSIDNGEHRGFDAAVNRREHDHLNRWPFAREIYGIAVTGPRQWSVRIGVYGEWGTGKTSVLEFVASMAKKDGQIIVRFNPWEHSSKDSLWRAFVLSVFTELEATFGTLPEADAARTKAWIGKVKNVITSVAGVANATVGKAVQASLDLVKQHFAFSQADLRSLLEIIGDKRIVILIDDLDRTAPELVPEILFALKELMDIPGFAFVCAFDPAVVGEVLHRYNPGFGRGLSFLEKIIDYPRWLPPPEPAALVNLAIAEAKQFCEYVPQEDWILEHASKVERSVRRVYNEILDATLVTYAKELREADGALIQFDRAPHEKNAELLIALLELLLFKLDRLDSETTQVDPKQLKRLFDTIASFSASTSPVQSRLWPRTEQLGLQIVVRWSGDLGPLMDVIHPYQSFGFTHYEGPTVSAFHRKLCAALLPKFARQILERFREPGFVDHLMQRESETYNMRSMLLDPNSPFWKEIQTETFQMLSEAASNRAVQENAYGLLQWFYYVMSEQHTSSETTTMKQLLSHADISKALWSAATATRLGSLAVYKIYRLPDNLSALGVTVDYPSWWTEAAQPFLQRDKHASGAKKQLPNATH